MFNLNPYYVGPYEILFFPNSIFSVLIFLNALFFYFLIFQDFLMVKLNCIHQKHV